MKNSLLDLQLRVVGLDFRMRLGQGAIRDGGYQNPNLLSSTFEAVVGAYYLDNNRDIETLRPLVEQLFDSVPQDFFCTSLKCRL